MEKPTLSFKERDRRFKLARDLMKDEGLDCLIAGPGNTYYSPDYFDAWFSHDNATGYVVMPLHGEPTYIVWSPMHGTLRMLANKKRGIQPWIEDYRVLVPTIKGIVTILREKGLASGKIGVLGLNLAGPGAIGGIAYGSWSYVLKELPEASFVDATGPFIQRCRIKSEEELALARYTCFVGELACDAMLKATKSGVSEAKIYAATMAATFENAANALHVILQTGVENVGWGLPMWTYQAQEPVVLGKGDLVLAELFQDYGGIEAQEQMMIATKPVAPITRELANICRRSYDIALKVMRPGVTFGEVCDEMEKPIKDAGCWWTSPVAHALSPHAGINSGTNMGIDKVPELQGMGFEENPMSAVARQLVIKPGMIFQIQPCACRGLHHGNIGGTVIVNENGVEELNKIATEMHVVD
jgi:Xaa-Pro dipeptidase